MSEQTARLPQASPLDRLLSRPLIVRPTHIIFWTLFCLVFLLSGTITVIGVIPYRMGVMSLLVLPLILLYGIRLNAVTVTYAGLITVIILSAIVNRSGLTDVALFMRILVFSYLAYYLVERYVNQANIERIIRICVAISIIQLPILLLQRAVHHLYPERIRTDTSIIDIGYGTFNHKGDSSMTFFLILIIIFILFEPKRSRFIPWRPLLLVYLSATVLIANSEINKVTLVLVWGAYFATKLNRKTTMRLIGVFLIFVMGLVATGYATELIEQQQSIWQSLERGLRGNPRDIDRYLSGQYSRGGAINYYLSNDFLWVGDGPSQYSNPVNRERVRGNVGHIFTFYSEVGFIGWLASMLIFFLIAFRGHRAFLRLSWVPAVSVGAIFVLSFTNQIMNDISVVMAFCIFAKSYLIPMQSESTLKSESVQN